MSQEIKSSKGDTCQPYFFIFPGDEFVCRHLQVVDASPAKPEEVVGGPTDMKVEPVDDETEKCFACIYTSIYNFNITVKLFPLLEPEFLPNITFPSQASQSQNLGLGRD